MNDDRPADDLERRSADLLAHALHYAAMGYPVFPTQQNIPGDEKAKFPLTDRGFMDASTNEIVIRNWWTKWPLANVAICTAGLVVVDTDPGNTWLHDLPELAEDLLIAPQSQTPRGGYHRWFRQPEGKAYRCTTSRMAPHVDTRANGGYVVVAPSMVNDRPYQWIAGSELTEIEKLPLPPDWLVMELDRIDRGTVVIDDAEAVSPSESIISEGGRNATLTRIGGYMRRGGFSRVEIEAALLRVNIERCVPRLESKEVQKIAWSVSRYEPDQTTVAMIENHYGEDRGHVDEVPAVHEPESPGPLPPELLRVPGLIGRVADFTNATSHRLQRDLSFAGALSLMSVLTGRKIADEYGTRTNLYLFGLAPSGGGKDRARQVNKEIMTAAGGLELIGQESFASSQGLFSQIEARGVVLCQVDELGEFLRAIKNPRASHLQGVTAELLKLYSSAGSVYMGPAYADAKRNKSINQPHFVMYGTTVAESFFESLTVDSITGGFLARSIFFEGTKDLQPKQACPEMLVPTEITQEVKTWLAFAPGGNLAGSNPQPRRVPVTPAANEVFSEAERHADERHNMLGFPLGTIFTRLVEQARKLALLRACSQWGPDAAAVTDEDAAWGVMVMMHRCERMRWLAERRVSKSEYHALYLKCVARLEEAGEAGIEGFAWQQFIKHVDPVKRKQLQEDLIHNGEAQYSVIKSGKAGRPRKVIALSKFRQGQCQLSALNAN